MFYFLPKAEELADDPEKDISSCSKLAQKAFENWMLWRQDHPHEDSQLNYQVNFAILLALAKGNLRVLTGFCETITLLDSNYLQPLFASFADDDLRVSNKFITDNVKAIAERAYQERDWSAMPILADALQDAGCTSERIIKECQQGVHNRGCLILDSILDKY